MMFTNDEKEFYGFTSNVIEKLYAMTEQNFHGLNLFEEVR